MENKEEDYFEEQGSGKGMTSPENISDIQFEIEKRGLDKDKKDYDLNISSKEEAINYFKDFIYDGDVLKAKYIQKNFSINKEELDEILLTEFKFALSNGDIYKAINIKEEFDLSDDLFTDREIQEIALGGLKNALISKDIAFARIIKEAFSLENNEISAVAKDVIESLIENKDYENLEEIKDNFLKDSGLFDNIPGAENEPETEEHFPENEKAKEEAKKAFIHYLSKGDILTAIKIKKSFFSGEEVDKDEAREAAIQGMRSCLEGDDVVKATYIRKEMEVPQEGFEDMVTNKFIDYLSGGNIYGALNLKEEFGLAEELLEEERVIEAAGKGFSNALLKGDIGFAKIIKEIFLASSSEAVRVAEEFYDHYTVKGEIEKANEIKDSLMAS
ncbi:MAG: hypothetical protein PHW52_02460 [Candidatus Pacebacteria bacterium]|nr:hypothetical protein [Candidatus Paceibacterota bacterium]